jgi:hypothetical protein
MQYETARLELESPPATLSFWGMLSEAVVLTIAALALVFGLGL